MSHIGELGTVAFDLSVMRQLISIGGLEHDPETNEMHIVRELAPDTIQCSLWLRTVPDAYHDAAWIAVNIVRRMHDFVERPLTDELLNEFILQLQAQSLKFISEFAESKRKYRARYAEAERDAAQQKDFGVDLGDLGAIAAEIHHLIEGGQLDAYAIELLRRCIRHYGGRIE